METKLKKIVIALMAFVLVFSHVSFTLEALATTDEFRVISSGLFRKDEVNFYAYFEGENGRKLSEGLGNVNQNIRLTIEVTPQVEGFLKEGVIRAVADDGGSPNFKFVNVKDLSLDDIQMQTNLNTNKLTKVGTNSNPIVSTVTDETDMDTEFEDEISEDIDEDEINESEDYGLEEDELVDEDEIAEQAMNEANETGFITIEDVEIISDREIRITNLLEPKTIEVDLEFEQNTLINIDDLYKTIQLQLSGTYINKDLEEVEVGKEHTIRVGWIYSKDIKVTSEYTKFSPFKVGEKEGTIVENVITVSRQTVEEKYLPVKSTKIQVIAPEFNGEKPEEVNVQAKKLMATRGEEVGTVQFTSDNWVYDEITGIINIQVENGQEGWDYVINSIGEDEYVLTYRYGQYSEEEHEKLSRNVKVQVEEYSAKENNILTKEISDSQDIDVNVGELITYSIGVTDFSLSKGRINANYNSIEGIYETTYINSINVNILTSDMLEEFTINATEEYYIDSNETAFENNDVRVKEVRFGFADIKTILGEEGIIEIYDAEGELLREVKNEEIVSEEDARISIDNAKGVEVKLKNINSNGNVKMDLIKAIGKCSYDKTAFKNFTELESRLTGQVKYVELDEEIPLQEIGTRKSFKESSTIANIDINKDSLATMEENTDVEIKIQLNNNKETNDLYVNPCFEIVFPKYITEVEVENINLLYAGGLSIGKVETYKEYDIVKLRIELEGTQTEFSDSEITRGTNIIANVKMRLSEYTPRKQDQIKLYYYNEGATNYEAQTKWTINKPVPTGIIKQTNGVDITLVSYNAPAGLVAINGIRNYDGQLGEVRSVKQGEMIRKIQRKEDTQIATMEVLTLNNTGNVCTDVALIGRIPFKGNRDVVTGQDMGSTASFAMKDFMKADIQNPNSVRIYYSENENATKDLSNQGNGWTISPDNISEVKSYLIVVNDEVEPGAVLRFTYEFEIPSEMPYESSMYGSFGGYYNNNSDIAIIYESTVADKVGLVTESGPKVDVNVAVNIGDNNPVQETRFLEYTVTVANSGSITAENVKVENHLSSYVLSIEYIDTIAPAKEFNKLIWRIGILEPGQVQQYKYRVKTARVPTMEEYYLTEGNEIKQDAGGFYYEKTETTRLVEVECDGYLACGEYSYRHMIHTYEKREQIYVDRVIECDGRPHEGAEEVHAPHTYTVTEEGFEINKIYVPEMPDIYITNKAILEIANLAVQIESNETRNLLTKANFDIKLTNDTSGIPGVEHKMSTVGEEIIYRGTIKNISHRDLKDVTLEYKLPKEVQHIETTVSRDYENTDYNIEYDNTSHTVYVRFNLVEKEDGIIIRVKGKTIAGNANNQITYINMKTNDGVQEKSNALSIQYRGGILNVFQTSNVVGTTVKEREAVQFSIVIENDGNSPAINVKIENAISENLTQVKAQMSGSVNGNVPINNNKIDYNITGIPVGSRAVLTISGKAIDIEEGEQKTISNKALVIYQGEQETNLINIGIQPDQNKNTNTNQNTNTNTSTNTNKNTINNTTNNKTNTNTNTTNNTANNQNSNNNNNNNNNTNTTQTKANLSISGTVWLDENRDGKKDNGEKELSEVQVTLLKGKTIVKTTTTNAIGSYSFHELSAGDYTVEFKYDQDKYISTTYRKQNVEENLMSQAVGTPDGKAVTNIITLKDVSAENINFGMQNKEIVEFAIEKVISGATVTNIKNNKKDEKYTFDNLQLAKFEIPSKELKNSVVKLQYKILVKNTGNIDNKIDQIVDTLPKDTTMEEKENQGWYIGSDGNIYNDSLKNTDIKVGETKELTLIVTKDLSDEWTGVVSNKVLAKGMNNTFSINASQETIISVKTGNTVQILTIAIALAGIYIVMYKRLNGRIKLDLSKVKDIRFDFKPKEINWDKLNLKDKFSFSYKNKRK